MALTKNVTLLAMEKNLGKAKAFFELKQRQWQDFLLRDSKRIKHCPCGERDNSAMVRCDECFNWVHLRCAEMTEEEARAASDYMCSSCCLAEIKNFAEDFIRHKADEIDDDGHSASSEE